MGGVGGDRSKSSSSSSVPKFQQKYLKDLYARAQTMANDPIEQYEGQRIASQDPATLGYYDNALGYAQNGNATTQYLQDTVSGRYLDPSSNPYLRDTYDLASRAVTENYRDAVLPAIESRFARAGQAYSGQYEGARGRADQALGRSLGDLATQVYGGAYENERGRQQQAAPLLAADQMDRLDLARGVGSQRESYQQSLLDDMISRFDFAQNEPSMRLSRYASLLGNPIVLDKSSSQRLALNAQVGGALSRFQ
jgi:hypothetical protein